MFRSLLMLVKNSPIGSGACCAVIALSLGLAGCQGTNLRGEPFPQDDLGQLSGRLRATDPEFRPQTWSNQAREIERNLSGDVQHNSMFGP